MQKFMWLILASLEKSYVAPDSCKVSLSRLNWLMIYRLGEPFFPIPLRYLMSKKCPGWVGLIIWLKIKLHLLISFHKYSTKTIFFTMHSLQLKCKWHIHIISVLMIFTANEFHGIRKHFWQQYCVFYSAWKKSWFEILLLRIFFFCCNRICFFCYKTFLL